MPNLIDKEQLQATAQVAKSYILDQAISTADSLISAMSLTGSGSTPAPVVVEKQEPTLEINFTNATSGTYTYNGDGYVYGYATIYFDDTMSNYSYIQVNHGTHTFSLQHTQNLDDIYSVNVFLCASEGTNFAAKTVQRTLSL